jgi:hypothetical protein
MSSPSWVASSANPHSAASHRQALEVADGGVELGEVGGRGAVHGSALAAQNANQITAHNPRQSATTTGSANLAGSGCGVIASAR